MLLLLSSTPHPLLLHLLLLLTFGSRSFTWRGGDGEEFPVITVIGLFPGSDLQKIQREIVENTSREKE